MSSNSKDLHIPSSQSLLLFSNLTSFPTHTHTSIHFAPPPYLSQNAPLRNTGVRSGCPLALNAHACRGSLSLGPRGVGTWAVAARRLQAGRSPATPGSSANKGRGAARGARGAAGAELRAARAGWRGESGVLTEVSSRYTSGYWKDSMAGAERGLKRGSADEAGRGLRRRAACQRVNRQTAGRPACMGGLTVELCAKQEDAVRGREPLPGGRAQAAARGSGVAARAPERAHSSLCRSASRARAHGGARWPRRRRRHRATQLRDRPPAAPRYPAFPPFFAPGKGNFASSMAWAGFPQPARPPATLDVVKEMLRS